MAASHFGIAVYVGGPVEASHVGPLEFSSRAPGGTVHVGQPGAVDEVVLRGLLDQITVAPSFPPILGGGQEFRFLRFQMIADRKQTPPRAPELGGYSARAEKGCRGSLHSLTTSAPATYCRIFAS
jgi:hypothetical protein